MFDRNSIRWLRVYNADSEPAPPFALLAITGVDTSGNVTVTRPTANGQTGLLVNGPLTIPSGQQGQAHQTFPAVVAYQLNTTDDSVPANGQTWGAAANSWYLTSGQTGFLVVGGSSSGLTNVQPEASSSSPPASSLAVYNGATEIDAAVARMDSDSNNVLTWSEIAAGHVQAVVAAAGASAWGVVTTVTQQFAGNKEFLGSVQADAGFVTKSGATADDVQLQGGASGALGNSAIRCVNVTKDGGTQYGVLIKVYNGSSGSYQLFFGQDNAYANGPAFVLGKNGAVQGSGPFYAITDTLNNVYAGVTGTGGGGDTFRGGICTALGTSSSPTGPAPAPPTSVSGTAGSGQVALTWTASSGSPPATGYDVYYSTNSNMSGATKAGTTTGTSYTVTGLTNGTLYYFGVVAYNSGFNSYSAYSTITSYTPTSGSHSGLATIRGSATAHNNGAGAYTISITSGSTVVAGDTLLLVVASNGGASIATPTGWTVYETKTYNSALSTTVFTKTATSADISATYTINVTGSGNIAGGAALLDVQGVVDVSNTIANGSSSSAVTGTLANVAGLTIAVFTCDSGASSSSMGGGYSPVCESTGTALVVIGSQTFAGGATATAAINNMIVSANWFAQLIALSLT